MKMNAVDGNSKSRRNLANIYAIYSILHFYLNDFYKKPEKYKSFEGYNFTKLFNYCRTLYGGSKLQNHALNNRINAEFHNKFENEPEPIVTFEGRYALHPRYIYIKNIDMSKTIVKMIETYIELIIKKDNTLMKDIDELREMHNVDEKKRKTSNMIDKNTEARVFEIIAYAVLKNHYREIPIYIGYTPKTIKKEYLQLYKTGRTYANDGGIDYVMRPLGRFFQVTEVNDYDKYTLDMDKVLHYPLTFVIKTEKSKDQIIKELNEYIEIKSCGMKIIENRYRQSIEEIITINELKEWLSDLSEINIDSLLDDIELYYKIELNFSMSEDLVLDNSWIKTASKHIE